jgi:hypothetical protein
VHGKILPSLLGKNRQPTKMKTLIAISLVLLLGPAFAEDVPAQPPASSTNSSVHRYLVERTAALNALPVDSVTEVPVTLSPQ